MNNPMILVIEDDAPVRNLIVTTLKTHDYRYLTAKNGAEAILMAASHNPDVLFLDLGLPDMDGIDVIRQVRTWSNLPIIVISSSDGGGDRSVYTNGRLRIDYSAGCAYLDGEELKLTPMEYRILCLLARNTGKVLTHTFITQNIYGRNWENDIASLRVFMTTLRKKIEPDPDSPKYIQTHIGIGYRMLKVD